MTKIESIDLSGLNSMFSQLTTALTSRGQGGDLGQLLRVEGGQLAWDISEAMGPRSKSQAISGIEKELLGSLSTLPRHENLKGMQRYSSYAAFTWLYAGPNHLAGINDVDDQRDGSADEALQAHYATRKQGGRGKAWEKLGHRGRQHIMRLNRTRVSRAAFTDVKRFLQAGVGQLKASFAATAVHLLPHIRVPTWVRNQFPAVKSNGKQIFKDHTSQNRFAPFIEFGSRAKGVEGNPVIVGRIQGTIRRREVLLKQKIEKLIAGYTYEWNDGRVFRQRVERN